MPDDTNPKRSTGPGGHTNTPVGGKDAARIAEEFRQGQRERHKQRVAERAQLRAQARANGMDAGMIGPPNPYGKRKGSRPPMKG